MSPCAYRIHGRTCDCTAPTHCAVDLFTVRILGEFVVAFVVAPIYRALGAVFLRGAVRLRRARMNEGECQDEAEAGDGMDQHH